MTPKEIIDALRRRQIAYQREGDGFDPFNHFQEDARNWWHQLARLMKEAADYIERAEKP